MSPAGLPNRVNAIGANGPETAIAEGKSAQGHATVLSRMTERNIDPTRAHLEFLHRACEAISAAAGAAAAAALPACFVSHCNKGHESPAAIVAVDQSLRVQYSRSRASFPPCPAAAIGVTPARFDATWPSEMAVTDGDPLWESSDRLRARPE